MCRRSIWPCTRTSWRWVTCSRFRSAEAFAKLLVDRGAALLHFVVQTVRFTWLCSKTFWRRSLESAVYLVLVQVEQQSVRGVARTVCVAVFLTSYLSDFLSGSLPDSLSCVRYINGLETQCLDVRCLRLL